MQKGIIGKKLGMTQLFDANGKVVPVTIIEAGPCTVVQKKTVESDGYQAVQMGYGEVSAKKVNKAAKGHFDKADVAPKRTLREFRFDDIAAVNVGDIFNSVGDVDLGGVGSDLEGVLLVSDASHGVLGDDGGENDVLCEFHHAYTSSSFLAASTLRMSLSALTTS